MHRYGSPVEVSLRKKQRSVLAAAEELGTLTEPDPKAIRGRLLEALLRVGDASFAAYYTMTEAGGQTLLADWQVEGDALVDDALSLMARDPLAGPPFLNVRRPQPIETRTFLEGSAVWSSWDAMQETEHYRKIWAPNRIRDQLRLLVYEGDRFIGWIGLLRRDGDPPFRRSDGQRLAPLVRPIRAALIAADHLARLGHPSEGADLVVRDDGHLELASRHASWWIDRPGFVERLAFFVRAYAAGDDAPMALLRGARASVTRLSGDHGSRFLVHLSDPPVLLRAADSVLSPAQRETAKYAAAGATLSEIAQALGRKPETVRTHLREAYRRLGVSSRLELARVLGEQARPA